MTRSPIGYVVEVEGPRVTLNLLDSHRGQTASHAEGVSSVADVGGLVGIDAGARLFVVRVTGLLFSEPRDVHRRLAVSPPAQLEPLRQVNGYVVGSLIRSGGEVRFETGGTNLPALGAEAVPLTSHEIRHVYGGGSADAALVIGSEYRSGEDVRVGLNALLAQHVAVLGSSGQGKSSFTAAMLQQLAEMPGSRVVVFDIAGEYGRAFLKSEASIEAEDLSPRLSDEDYLYTVLGHAEKDATSLKIPYYAFGRTGLQKMLLPSERTQRPALNFAVDHLKNVEWHNDKNGVSLLGDDPVLFDDCRPGSAVSAMKAIDELRSGAAQEASKWPPMAALAPLVADSHSIVPSRQGGYERSAFYYGNVSPLVTRIHRLLDDEVFRHVVDVDGGDSFSGANTLSWQRESEHLVNQIFGSPETSWKVHVLDLKQVPQDLMPLILGSLLELYSQVLFRRGQGGSHATLLVLEEAHHYLRSHGDKDDDTSSVLAYERLAKEGRKFGLAIWLSTQRPSEVSPTVLSQCNTWVTFRLTSDRDLRAIASASDWADPSEIRRISGLPRRQAIIFGGSVAVPTTFVTRTADPVPESRDAPFSEWVTPQEAK